MEALPAQVAQQMLRKHGLVVKRLRDEIGIGSLEAKYDRVVYGVSTDSTTSHPSRDSTFTFGSMMIW